MFSLSASALSLAPPPSPPLTWARGAANKEKREVTVTQHDLEQLNQQARPSSSSVQLFSNLELSDTKVSEP